LNWTWFHKWGSPKWFFQKTEALVLWFGFLCLILLVVGTVWGLAFAPEDIKQGNSFRIFYIHVPSAILAQSIFMAMAISAVVGLVWRMKLAHIFVQVAAPIGASITLLALVTGAIWGKPTWGTWWVWDARLTSTLIQFFIYLGIISLYQSIENRDTAYKATAIACLVGIVNLPIIKFSVNWWKTLHQPATFKLTEAPSMAAEMWVPGLIMLVGFYLFFAFAVLVRMRSEVLEREKRTAWVREYLEKKNVL